MFATAAVPAVIQFVAFFFLPESPRWLVEHGREPEAKMTLNRMYTVQAWRDYELDEIVAQHEQIKQERAAQLASGQTGTAFC
jgi:SP family myo-inositol transporter-like MFS transporter 13